MRRRCGRFGNGSLAAALVVAVLATVSTPAASTSGFGDVDANAFYTDAVQWMVDNAITTGVSATCFAPDEPVTRGEPPRCGVNRGDRPCLASGVRW